jgi:DNA repair exonuclease SbcCD ATPase subunit
METLNYKELYEAQLAENSVLQTELNEKSSIVQILYNEMDELNSQLTHYKEMFSAANTNLMVNDKEVYELNEENKNIKQENNELLTRLENQTKEIEELKETNESNKEFINSYYKVNASNKICDSVSNSNSKTNSNLDKYELIPIDILTDWIIDYINSGCTFTIMKRHYLNVKMKQTRNNKERLVTYNKEFKNNKWTLRVFLKLFFIYHFPTELNKLYASEKQQNGTCTICYNKVVNPSILTCECKHIYCYKCIHKWICKEKAGCPCCRKKGTIFEAGPITPINYRMMIDHKHSVSSIPQHFRIFV